MVADHKFTEIDRYLFRKSKALNFQSCKVQHTWHAHHQWPKEATTKPFAEVSLHNYFT